MEVSQLIEQVRTRITSLRSELEKEEAFLFLLEERVGVTRPGTSEVPAGVPTPPDPTLRLNPVQEERGDLRQVTRRRKIELAEAAMKQRPGVWTTAEMRTHLEAAGYNAEAGTPIKNVLWQMAEAGQLDGLGGGRYRYPPSRDSTDSPEPGDLLSDSKEESP